MGMANNNQQQNQQRSISNNTYNNGSLLNWSRNTTTISSSSTGDNLLKMKALNVNFNAPQAYYQKSLLKVTTQ